MGHSEKDLRPVTFARFNARLGKPKPITGKRPLDSGASGSSINAKFTKKLHFERASATAVWSTPAGEMSTSSAVNGVFTIAESQEKKLIEWPLHVIENMGPHDMILGRDVMSFLGIDILFSQKVVVWNGSELPFKPISADVDKDHNVEESVAVHTSTEQIKEILDAKCEAADLDQVCSSQEHPSPTQRQQLKRLLDKCAELFDGTLGTWNLEPVELELKPDATPHHSKPHPVPRVHQETLKMEVERLCKISVLKRVNRSEWAAPFLCHSQERWNCAVHQ